MRAFDEKLKSRPELVAFGNATTTYFCKPTEVIHKKLDKTLTTGNANNILVYDMGKDIPEGVKNKTGMPQTANAGHTTTLDTLLRHFLEQKVQIDAIHVKLDKLLHAGGVVGVGVAEIYENIKFPLKTLDDIQELEEHLKEDNYRINLENHLNLVGGADSPKLIRRCLARIFSDTLANQCSFTGAKENFRVKDLILIQELRKVVHQNFPDTSDFEFEKVVKDFFRYAGQRLRIASMDVGKIKKKRACNVYGQGEQRN